jgi:hypothetical protein
MTVHPARLNARASLQRRSELSYATSLADIATHVKPFAIRPPLIITVPLLLLDSLILLVWNLTESSPSKRSLSRQMATAMREIGSNANPNTGMTTLDVKFCTGEGVARTMLAIGIDGTKRLEVQVRWRTFKRSVKIHVIFEQRTQTRDHIAQPRKRQQPKKRKP